MNYDPISLFFYTCWLLMLIRTIIAVATDELKHLHEKHGDTFLISVVIINIFAPLIIPYLLVTKLLKFMQPRD